MYRREYPDVPGLFDARWEKSLLNISYMYDAMYDPLFLLTLFVKCDKVQPVQPAEPRHWVSEDLADLPDRRRDAPDRLGDSLLERRPGGEETWHDNEW